LQHDKQSAVCCLLSAVCWAGKWKKTTIFPPNSWIENESDYLTSKLQYFSELPGEQQQKISSFLRQHQQENKIVLTAERSPYLLQPP